MIKIPKEEVSEGQGEHWTKTALQFEFSNGGGIDESIINELLTLLEDARIMDYDTLELLPKDKNSAIRMLELLFPKDEYNDNEFVLPADEFSWVKYSDGKWWLQLWWD